MVDSNLEMLMEVVEAADDGHDPDNEQPMASVAFCRMSNPNNHLSLEFWANNFLKSLSI